MSKDKEIHTVSVYVSNKPGALARMRRCSRGGDIILSRWWFLRRSWPFFADDNWLQWKCGWVGSDH